WPAERTMADPTGITDSKGVTGTQTDQGAGTPAPGAPGEAPVAPAPDVAKAPPARPTFFPRFLLFLLPRPPRPVGALRNYRVSRYVNELIEDRDRADEDAAAVRETLKGFRTQQERTTHELGLVKEQLHGNLVSGAFLRWQLGQSLL